MIRFGVVGAGSIARKFVSDIKASNKAKVVGIASRSIEKANAFKDEFGIEYAFGNYEEMAKSNLIDAVYIATPHNFHKEQTIMFLNNDKHVLCEKPISVNASELTEMITCAKTNNKLLMEAMWSRFLPVSKKVKSIVDSGIYGKIKEINLELGYKLIDSSNKNGRLLNPNLAAGALLDLGVYPISFMNYLKNDPIKNVEVSFNLTNKNIDIEEEINITFNDNVKASLRASMANDWNKDGNIIFAEHVITIPDFSRSEVFYINDELFTLKFREGGFTDQIDAFADTISSGKIDNDVMPLSESLEVMKLLDKIRNKMGVKYPFE